MPFAGETAVLQMLGPMQHPGLGTGVLCVLVLPVLAFQHALAGEGIQALLARLNAQRGARNFMPSPLPPSRLGAGSKFGHPALAAFVPAPLAAMRC